MPDPIHQKIADCWRSGIGIKETIIAVRRCYRETVTFDQVRQIFARLSWAELT